MVNVPSRKSHSALRPALPHNTNCHRYSSSLTHLSISHQRLLPVDSAGVHCMFYGYLQPVRCRLWLSPWSSAASIVLNGETEFTDNLPSRLDHQTNVKSQKPARFCPVFSELLPQWQRANPFMLVVRHLESHDKSSRLDTRASEDIDKGNIEDWVDSSGEIKVEPRS